jgi:cobalt-zinc-cadmium efflux system outer membrane protein
MKGRRPMQALLLLLLICGIAEPVHIQAQTTSLTLEQALNRARTRAPALLAARARIEEARGRLQGASILFQANPVIEGTVGPRFSNQGRTTDADVSVSQDFEAFGRRSARISGAQAGVARTTAASQETGRQLLRDVAAAFMRALAANEKLKALTDADKLSSDFLSTAERRYQAGDVPILDVNLARTGAARTHSELRSGLAELASALGDLRVLLGMGPGEQFTPAGDLKNLGQYDLTSLINSAQDRPDIKVLESELREAESEARLGNTFKSPDFGVIGRYVRDQGDNITQGGIRITIPVFSRGQELRATGNSRASRIRAELEASKTAIRNEISSAFDVYRFRTEAAQELEIRALPSLQENETLARRSYEEGEMGLVELLLIRREILETRLSYANALLEAALAGVDLQSKAGVLR